MDIHSAGSGAVTEHAGAEGSLLALASYNGPILEFLPTVLKTIRFNIPDGESAVYSTASNAAPKLMAAYPSNADQHPDQGAWLGRVGQILAEQSIAEACTIPQYSAEGKQLLAQLLVVPLHEPVKSESWGYLCLLLRSSDTQKGRQALYQMLIASQIIANYQLRQAGVQREIDLQAISRAMQLVDVVNREPRFKTAAIGMCNQAADTWQASRVSVGFLTGQTVKLRAMSHTEDISRKMQIVQDLEAAMEECVDQDSELLVPRPSSATTINRQAKRYADKHGPCHMCIMPLRLHDKIVGAMAVEWDTDHVIGADDVESLRLAANLFTARLHQFHLDDRWLGARMATSLREAAGVAVGPKHTWAKLLAIGICAFLAFALFVKGDDTVDSSFTVQTTSRQVITAPYAGTLLSVGEGVDVNEPVLGTDQQAGEATVLAMMDTSELRVERAAVEAQIADFQAQADAARGENDLAGVEVAMANVRRLQAQADLYDYRIERSTLISPVSGVVIEGDLRQRINGVLEKGEVLFEIAPLDALRAEMLVPASRIGDVRSRLEHPDNPSRGELASVSHPGDFIGFTVERIEPEAEVVDGQNVFRVRVSLDEITPWLRPGVEGKAKVFVGRRNYATLWTRDAVNWVRMKLWL